MKIKNIQLTILFFTLISCATTIKKSESFEQEFFENPQVIYRLKKEMKNDKIKIFDNNFLPKDQINFKQEDLEITFTDNISTSDFIIKQYTINADLAFIVFWRSEGNKTLWFYLNKGKNTKKWQVLDVLEKTKM